MYKITVPIEAIAHLVEDRIYIPEDTFLNSKIFPKEPLIEYWPYLNRYYGTRSNYPDFNEYLSNINILNDCDYYTISNQNIFCFDDNEFFEFIFPTEEMALYFKIKLL